MLLGTFVAIALAATQVAGHPGHNVAKEAADFKEFLLHSRSDLSHCAEALRAQGIHERNVERRAKLAEGLMQKRGLEGMVDHWLDTRKHKLTSHCCLIVRQLSTLNKSHKSSQAYTAATDFSVVFAGNKSCVLAPEQIDGPYCE